ncbi:MAG: replication factor C small subunit [Thermoplasmata archaeon]|nr:replication factor C small subunit [Thermoplasmata archaeon]MCJ7561948.1 replication factor C small subunit [Thermoplasmata archaeon]
MADVWVEKYRPKKLADVIGQKIIVERLSAYVRTVSMPHMLFAGPAGCGKTTCSIALARELYGDQWKGNFLELNASDERGIDIVRGKIKDFARAASMGQNDFKIIFLDEADSLTGDAQAALRRTMERYTQTCRFVLSCNYSSKIIEPIQSRCAVFRFRPLSEPDVRICIERISKVEGIEVSEEGYLAIAQLAGGDLRKATNILQVASSMGGKVDAETVFESTENIRPSEIQELLTTALKGSFMAARSKLDDMIVIHGLSGEDIVKAIHRAVLDLPVNEDVKIRLIDRVGEAEFRMVSGSSERIQLEALLAHFAYEGKNGRS